MSAHSGWDYIQPYLAGDPDAVIAVVDLELRALGGELYCVRSEKPGIGHLIASSPYTTLSLVARSEVVNGRPTSNTRHHDTYEAFVSPFQVGGCIELAELTCPANMRV